MVENNCIFVDIREITNELIRWIFPKELIRWIRGSISRRKRIGTDTGCAGCRRVEKNGLM